METLTVRQFDVVRLAADGMTNTEIGTELGIAPSSVKSHLETACKKLGARDRTNAVHKAHLAGYFGSLGVAGVRA